MRLIDADALIEYICGQMCGCKRNECGLTYERDGTEVCSTVGFIEENAPTIDSVPVVHGYNKRDCESLYECSVCGWECWDTLCGDTDIYNFCPNCGAKMDGKEKDDEQIDTNRERKQSHTKSI